MIRFDIRKLIYGILFLIILLNNAIEQIIPMFGYLDELIVMWALVYVSVNYNKFGNREYLILLCLSLVILFGILSNAMYGLQPEIIAIIKDIAAFIKLPIVALAGVIWRKNNYWLNLNQVGCAVSKLVIPIMFFFCIASQYVDFGMTHDERLWVKSFKFFYVHPTFVVLSIVMMTSVLVSSGLMAENKIFIICSIIILLSTMRDKGFAYICLLIYFVYLAPRLSMIKIRNLLPVMMMALVVSYNKISDYMSYSWSPRMAMYKTSIDLIKDYFPLGSGFGSFASHISAAHYALTYYVYGFADKIGEWSDELADFGDAGYPYYAQFGFFGILFMIIVYYCLLRSFNEIFVQNIYSLKGGYLLIGYMAIAAVVENVFCNESGATVVIVIFMYLNTIKQPVLNT